jgi:hypothetical protein
MVPFLKGLHLTIDNWRPEWYGEGWKLSHARIEATYVMENESDLYFYESQGPVGWETSTEGEGS